MYRHRRIFLIGPMGAGKTSIGKVLASQLGLAFVDSDEEIEARAGASVSWIFDVEGEDRFRDWEARVLEDLTQRRDIVLATGGGAVLRRENRQLLAARGFVIYLYTPVEEQFARTRDSRRRPLLQTENPEQTLRELMAVRDPLYRQAADYVAHVNTSSRRADLLSSARDLARIIEAQYQDQGGPE